MQFKQRILVISEGEFSGVTPALCAALQRAGCEVIRERQSLRQLGGLLRLVYGAWMKANALVIYGRNARLMLDRTRAAYVARSRVSQALVARHPGVDVVLLIAANSNNHVGRRPAHTRFVIYTDYANLISKSLPDRGFALTERRTYALWNRLERLALSAQDRVFVMGRHVKPALERAYGISPHKVSVVGAGPGLDVDIARDRREKDWSRPALLFVGKLAGVKGLRVLLQAFASVRQEFPDSLLHVVTGNPVAAPGVVFHGSLDEPQLKELFYDNHVFVMPAFKEPLGLVFLEAMWSGMACIGTRTGSMPEMISDGDTGLVVEPGDVEALARAMATLLRDPARTRLMGERGYRAARDYWHWDAVAQRMLTELR